MYGRLKPEFAVHVTTNNLDCGVVCIIVECLKASVAVVFWCVLEQLHELKIVHNTKTEASTMNTLLTMS